MAVLGDSGVTAVAGATDTPSGEVQGGGIGSALPQDLSSFVGREREVAEVVALVERARLVTLIGPGGSGKTRLAIEAARRAAPRMDVAFVDLAPTSDPGLIVPSIAAALGVRAEPSRALEAALVESIGRASRLVVLDNLEQLLPEAGVTLLRLLGACPNLRMLATSRAQLHVRGEQEYLVEPLAQVEAEALFIDRAQAVDPRFQLTDHNRAAVDAICRRLDGLPLAIELAAARARVMTPEALLRRLQSGGSVPASSAIDAPARQRTLHDTIAWSFGLLSSIERVVFGRVCVFVGGFSGEAAADVGRDPTDLDEIDVGRVLGRLVDHSLVRVAPDLRGEPRFGLLETIREFGLGQLSAVEVDRTRRRHATYFTQALVAGTDYGAAPFPENVVVEEDFDNVRAALAWADATGETRIVARLAVAASVYYEMGGNREEVNAWLAAAERASPEAEPAVRAGLLHYRARYELAFGSDRQRAQDLLQEALAILEDAGDLPRATRILEHLTHVALDLGDRATATARWHQAIVQARRLPDPIRRARFMAALAFSCLGVDSPTAMQGLAEEALAEGRRLGDEATVLNSLLALGYMALAKGELRNAVEFLSEAQAMDRYWEPWGPACGLAIARHRLGDLESSRSLLVDALPRARRLALTWVGLMALEAAADWLGAAGRHDQAVTCWATIDAVRKRTLDRTFGNDLRIFDASRDRDRKALKRAAWETAAAAGGGMSLDACLAFAMTALESPEPARQPERVGRLRPDDLTPREREVLALVAAGRSDGQIAEALFITKSTAAVHVANIKGKLGVASRVEIATTAISQGLIQKPPA